MKAPISSLRDLKFVMWIPTGPIKSWRWTLTSSFPSIGASQWRAVQSTMDVGYKWEPVGIWTSSPWTRLGIPLPPHRFSTWIVTISLCVLLMSTQESFTTNSSTMPSSLLDTHQHLVAQPLKASDLNNSSTPRYFFSPTTMYIALPSPSHTIVSS